MEDQDIDMKQSDEATEAGFSEDDVFFECPRCGKSMAISKDGIGMVVNCTECGLDIIVPEPGEPAESADVQDEEIAKASKTVYAGDIEYKLTRETRDILFDEIAAIQRSLDRLVSALESLET
jgi:transcription elongation factor Elf1